MCLYGLGWAGLGFAWDSVRGLCTIRRFIDQSPHRPKTQAAIEAAAAIPAAEQRLIFKGKVLKDEQALKFYGARPPCVLLDG